MACRPCRPRRRGRQRPEKKATSAMRVPQTKKPGTTGRADRKKTFGYVQRSDLTRDHSLVCAHLHTRRVLQAPSGLARSMTLGSPLVSVRLVRWSLQADQGERVGESATDWPRVLRR